MAHLIEKPLQKANFAFKSPFPRSAYSCTVHCGSRFSRRISSFFKGFWKLIVLLFIILSFLLSFSLTNADTLPQPDALGLPFENSTEATTPIVKIIKESIKYVGLLAILALSWGGIQFLTSIGNEEKVKSAKHTVIYSLVGVLLSVVAYTIVDIINSLRI